MTLIKINTVIYIDSAVGYKSGSVTFINTDKIIDIQSNAKETIWFIDLGGSDERQHIHIVDAQEFVRILPLLTGDAPAAQALPAWNEGVNTLAFSKLMDAWYEAKKIVSSFNGQEAYRLEAVTAVKDAYYAVIDYINKAHPIIESEADHE